jgi:hypothetical protein
MIQNIHPAPDPDLISPIPDPGIKRASDPGSWIRRSATLVSNVNQKGTYSRPIVPYGKYNRVSAIGSLFEKKM